MLTTRASCEPGADRCYHCRARCSGTGCARRARGGLRARRVRPDPRRPLRLPPGRRAAGEHRVRAPAARRGGPPKHDVRALSRGLGLPTANLPASPCLASRIPYGTTDDRGERSLANRAGGSPAARSRLPRSCASGTWARSPRVEIAPLELPRLERRRDARGRARGRAPRRLCGGRDRPAGLQARPAQRGTAGGQRGRPQQRRYMML